MTTLIAVYTSSGLIGRCDAKCYEAITPLCECMCGGRNHGKGREYATSNTRALAEEWITTYTQSRGLVTFTTEVHPECQHRTLWEECQ
jgi:hypothetical protein